MIPQCNLGSGCRKIKQFAQGLLLTVLSPRRENKKGNEINFSLISSPHQETARADKAEAEAKELQKKVKQLEGNVGFSPNQISRCSGLCRFFCKQYKAQSYGSSEMFR